jgi:hypothetical protein
MTPRTIVLTFCGIVALGIGVCLLADVRSHRAETCGRRLPTPTSTSNADREPLLLRLGRQFAHVFHDGAGTSTNEPAIVVAGTEVDGTAGEAISAYNRGELEDAQRIAAEALQSSPSSPRMQWIVVAVSCVHGDSTAARLHHAQLSAGDQEQVEITCAHYGITFEKDQRAE